MQDAVALVVSRLALPMSGPLLRVVADEASRGELRGVVLGEALARETPVLLAAARALVWDEREAEDLVATTLEIAVRRIASLREPAALRAWLLAIQTREAFRVRRRLARLVRLDGSVAELAIGTFVEADHLEVREALRRLPARMRAAVVLHHMIGLSVGETATALGTSENTVKSQLRVGLARLREALGD